MTTLVWREEVSADAPGKRVFSERCVLAGGEPAPSGANGNTVDRYRLKPLQRAVVRPIRELDADSQNGNLGLGRGFRTDRTSPRGSVTASLGI
jgi:hypothetical protein